jgi:hypothetical protein
MDERAQPNRPTTPSAGPDSGRRTKRGSSQPEPRGDAEREPGQAAEIWRPSVSSFRSLTAFALALCAAATTVLALTHSVPLSLVTLGMGCAAGLILTKTVSGNRVRASLEVPEHPELGNWPGTTQERRVLVKRGRIRMARAVAMALAVGALAGFYPVFAVAAIGAGAAGGISAWVIARTVRRFEIDHDVTVLTASRRGGFRRPLLFGVAPGRL